MPTPAERQALLFIAAVAALGIGVRACRAIDRPSADPPADTALATQLARVDSVIATRGPRRSAPAERGAGRDAARRSERREPAAGAQSRPSLHRPPATAESTPAPAGPLDVDVASLEELDRLPGIGPALAARIVEERERLGPFGSMEALDRVRGIGPALAERLRPHVTFSGAPRPPDTEVPVSRRGRRP